MKALFCIGALCLFAFGAALAATNEPLSIRIGSGETDLARYKEYNYTAAILGDVNQLAAYDSACPNAIAKGTALRRRIDQHRREFQKRCEQAKALGLAVCLLTDEVSMPTPVLDRLRKSGARGKALSDADFENPAFWELYRAKYREVLKSFPQAAYVIVRTGENYSHPDLGLVGRTVLDGKYDEAYFRNMRRLIEETRAVVADEFGRTLIWRTWDLGNDGFHANPKVYDRVLAGLTNRSGLVLAIKFTQTDFWRYNDFNPMIGRGGVDQVIEFQCAREYEGKGAFPNFVGPIHAEAMSRMAALGTKGVWIWDFGGGWGGPFLKSDRWVRLNIEATTRLALNPQLAPRVIAEEWAAKEFGPKAATNVADMLMLSSECVRKFRYIEAYARDHRGWKPTLNLMRDDIIRGEVLKQLYDGTKQSLPEVFAEKEEAVALAEKMRALFEQSRDDIVAARGEAVYRESLGSLIYMESLARVMCHYVNGMFEFYQWQETRDPATAAKARRELQAWGEAWQYYQTEVPKLPGVASLYRSQNAQSADSAGGAMAELCEAALRALPSDSSHSPANQAALQGAALQGRN